MNRGSAAQKSINIIDMQSYESGYASGYTDGQDDGYEAGYRACIQDRKRKIKNRRRQRRERSQRRLYFLKQKAVGVVFLLIAAWTVKILEGDITFAFVAVPLGLALIFGKEMYWNE